VTLCPGEPVKGENTECESCKDNGFWSSSSSFSSQMFGQGSGVCTQIVFIFLLKLCFT